MDDFEYEFEEEFEEHAYTFKSVPTSFEDWMDAFDIEEILGILNRRRQKIVQRSRLTEAEDAELYHIDMQIERFQNLLEEWRIVLRQTFLCQISCQ